MRPDGRRRPRRRAREPPADVRGLALAGKLRSDGAVRRLALVSLACGGCLFRDPGPGDGSGDADGDADGGTSGAPVSPGECAWEQLAPKSAPPARVGASLTLDVGRAALVLYGGREGPKGEALGDTWEYDGAAWRAAEASGGPGRRWGHAAAYDDGREQLVVFGGARDAGPAGRLRDTWTRGADGWRDRKVAGPSQRTLAAMTTGTGGLLLFGGLDDHDKASGETWLWDGDAWERVADAGPSPRFAARMAREPGGAVLLFGGCAEPACAEPLGDTWAWDGDAWTQVLDDDAPGTAAGVIAVHELAVLRIDEDLGYRWGDGAWSRVTGTTPLAGSFAAAFHPGAAGVVLFGGLRGAAAAGETWVYRCE